MLTLLGVVVGVLVSVAVVASAAFAWRGFAVAVEKLQTCRAFVVVVAAAVAAAVVAVAAVAAVSAVAAALLLCGLARSDCPARCCPRTSRFVVLLEESALVCFFGLSLLLVWRSGLLASLCCFF